MKGKKAKGLTRQASNRQAWQKPSDILTSTTTSNSKQNQAKSKKKKGGAKKTGVSKANGPASHRAKPNNKGKNTRGDVDKPKESNLLTLLYNEEVSGDAIVTDIEEQGAYSVCAWTKEQKTNKQTNKQIWRSVAQLTTLSTVLLI